MDVIISPEFEEVIKKIKDKKQIDIIENDIKRLMKEGEKIVKVLFQKGRYALGEIKHHKPPHRLYVILDYKQNVIYIIDWKHKKEQEKVIERLKEYIKLKFSL